MSTTRDAIIRAAAALLDQGGPEAITLREVGRLAGVSHNAPYRHFRDREALLAAVAAQELSRRPARARSDGDPGAGLRAMAQDYVAWARRYPQRFKLAFGPWRGVHAELGDSATAARQSWITAVSAAQAQGVLPSGEPERVAALLLAVAHGAADLALGGHLARDGKGAADPEDLLDDLFAHLAAAATVSPDRSRP